MKRALVLIDGLHSAHLFDTLRDVLAHDKFEIVLVYVTGHSPRASLDLVRRRPGGPRGLPPQRERGMLAADEARATDALDEAEGLARPLSGAVRRIEAHGEAGRVFCDFAAQMHADLAVVRARPLGPVARFIADHCPCPVLLVR